MLLPKLSSKVFEQDTGSGGSVPNTGSGQGEGDTGDKGQQAAGDKNNDNNNLDSHKNIWDTGKPTEKDKPTLEDQNALSAAQDKSIKDFHEYVQGQTFGEEFTPDALKKMLEDGDTTPLNTAIASAAKAGFGKALQDTQKIIEAAITKGTADAVAQSKAATSEKDNINAMNIALPFTKDPNVAPIAELALQTQMKAGRDFNTALESVKGFFSKMSTDIADHTGDGGPRNRGQGDIRRLSSNEQTLDADGLLALMKGAGNQSGEE